MCLRHLLTPLKISPFVPSNGLILSGVSNFPPLRLFIPVVKGRECMTWAINLNTSKAGCGYP